MNTTELLQYHDQLCSKAKEIMAKKNHDYSGASGETPFANFHVSELLNITSTEKGILIRTVDKIQRLITYANAGELKVQNESTEDAIVDIINYVILLAGVLKEKSMQEKQPGPIIISPNPENYL